MQISAGQARHKMLKTRDTKIFAYNLRFNWLMFKICRAANKGKSYILSIELPLHVANKFAENLKDLDYSVSVSKGLATRKYVLKIAWD